MVAYLCTNIALRPREEWDAGMQIGSAAPSSAILLRAQQENVIERFVGGCVGRPWREIELITAIWRVEDSNHQYAFN